VKLKRESRADWDELCDWYCRIAALRRLDPAPKFTIFSPQWNPEQIRGEAPLEVDIAAGREASGPVLRHRLTGRSQIPMGAWPRQMCAAFAAAYCGEVKIEDFLDRVGAVYPYPRVRDGRRQLWLRDDLDRALLPKEWLPVTDAAEDL
jgi:hypothetical protein